MKIKNIGKIKQIKDGIVIADGLSAVGYGELVNLYDTNNNKFSGIALNLEKDQVGIIVIDDYSSLKEGDRVEATFKLPTIKVSEALLSHTINPLGNLVDGDFIEHRNYKEMLLEKIAPGVIGRKDVTRPLQTGIKTIDSMLPIGRGQRQLIIGDRQTGKTALAIDAIINQKNSSQELDLPQVYCIYVAIGQKASKIAQIRAKLEEEGALDYTVIVASTASDPASLQYLAPYVGCAIGEYFAEQGKDALIVYDDLTKHAWAYREISLLLRRPPGREAYPGDIFYLHSRLLERAVQFSDDKGGGSLTALPIIETQAGDVSAYIPTNVISITDGQIYLESDLFNAGVRPAINIGLSVSRVGGAAQLKPMKQVAGRLRLDLAQYRELAAFAQFGSELDKETQKKLDRGARLIELLKQNQYMPLEPGLIILLIYMATNGYIDDIKLADIKRFEYEFINFVRDNYKEVLLKLAKNEKIDESLEKEIKQLISKFKQENSILWEIPGQLKEE